MANGRDSWILFYYSAICFFWGWEVLSGQKWDIAGWYLAMLLFAYPLFFLTDILIHVDGFLNVVLMFLTGSLQWFALGAILVLFLSAILRKFLIPQRETDGGAESSGEEKGHNLKLEA